MVVFYVRHGCTNIRIRNADAPAAPAAHRIIRNQSDSVGTQDIKIAPGVAVGWLVLVLPPCLDTVQTLTRCFHQEERSH